MLKIVQKYTIFLVLLILFSCSQESSVLMNTVDDYSLESVENGTFLEAGSSINIVFSEIGNRADLVNIILEDKTGTEIASAEVEPEMLKGLGMPLDLPSDLDDGVYYLRFSITDGDIPLYQDQRYFFISSGNYSISSLETYPPGIKPGDSITARIVLNYPDEADPWLRWTLADEILQEGLLSEMGMGCSFSVPEEGGVYSLRVEVFPVSPQAGQKSSLYRYSDLFVTTTESDDVPWKFIEDRTYLYFIEFEDALNNRMSPDIAPQIIGEPVASIQDNYSGILFSEDDGLHFTDYALPAKRDGSTEDFLLAMAFSTADIPEEGVYNVFQSSGNFNSFSVLYLADNKEFFVEFKTVAKTIQSFLPLDAVVSQEDIFLEMSYSSLYESDSLHWMVNGSIVETDTVRNEESSLKPFGEAATFLGSNGSSPGLPMTWYTFAISSESYSPLSEKNKEPSSQTLLENGLLYERSDKHMDEIKFNGLNPGTGLASMVILSDPGAVNQWVLNISDDQGNILYSLSAPEIKDPSGTPGLLENHLPLDNLEEQDPGFVEDPQLIVPEKNKVPAKIVLSLINDERGFFLNSSADSSMAGPYDFQKSLNINISALSEGAINDIKSIQFFQD